ncbi:hypothetical protein F5X96DRAFT_515040 [Biscogniauxia mediterranea]|nr:hypothetical protein F5X96DRAFT_515040 [Biscogniauxia mediterranea]
MANIVAQQIHTAIQAAIQIAVDKQTEAFTAETSQLRAEQNRIRSEYTTALAALAASIPRQRCPVLPDPALLAKPSDFDTWVLAMEGKLRVDGEAIGSAEAQFYYVYFRLEPKLQKLVIPLVAQAKATQTWDPQGILDAIRGICKDPSALPGAPGAPTEAQEEDRRQVDQSPRGEDVPVDPRASRRRVGGNVKERRAARSRFAWGWSKGKLA